MADAVRAYTLTRLGEEKANSYTIKWEGLDSDDTGTPFLVTPFDTLTVQVTGTFGSGGSISFYGSNDGTNYVILKDRAGNAITFTGAGLKEVGQLTAYIRPGVTAGDGSTSLVLTAFLRSNG